MTDRPAPAIGQIRLHADGRPLRITRIDNFGMCQLETLAGDWSCLTTPEGVSFMPLIQEGE
jgi:hypothetical protein